MKTNVTSDKALLQSYIQDGDKVAIGQLIERHRNRVYGYIFMMVKNHAIADDIFQDTFIKVISSLDRGAYTESGRFVPWVLRIAHNQVIDHFRAQKTNGHITSDDVGYDIFNQEKFSDDNVEDVMIKNQTIASVRKLVDMLPDDQREVVMMRHYMGLSFKEIAERTDVSINTALGRMRYALINLKKLINEHKMSLV